MTTPEPSPPPPEPGEMVCPSCLAANAAGAHICGKCRAPLDSFAATDPVASIEATYDTVGKALRHPTSVLKLLGVWLIFGSMAAGMLVGLMEVAKEFAAGLGTYGGPNWFTALSGGGVALAVLGFAVFILGRVTWNFVRERRRRLAATRHEPEPPQREPGPADPGDELL